MIQRGVNPHFFSKIGENGVWISATFLKKWPKGGYPLLGGFLTILGKRGPKRWIPGAPVGRKVLEKRAPTHLGRSQRPSGGCIWDVLCLHCPNTPSGWLTSPHMGGVPFSLIPCTPLGAPVIHRLGPLWPKMTKNPPKRGYPPFWPLFQEGSRNPDPIFANFRKKVRIFPPLDHPSGGGSALLLQGVIQAPPL